MTSLSTKKTKAARELMGMLDTIPPGQKKNWDNHLIPYFVKRLKEWTGAELDGDIKRNYQYANLLIDKKIFPHLCWLVWPDTGRTKCPFPQDIALALEWILHAGEQCPENKAQMNNFYFIYKNFEKIMKKQPCSKTKK